MQKHCTDCGVALLPHVYELALLFQLVRLFTAYQDSYIVLPDVRSQALYISFRGLLPGPLVAARSFGWYFGSHIPRRFPSTSGAPDVATPSAGCRIRPIDSD